MRTGVSIGGSESMALKGALLVYEGRHGAFPSWLFQYAARLGIADEAVRIFL